MKGGNSEVGVMPDAKAIRAARSKESRGYVCVFDKSWERGKGEGPRTQVETICPRSTRAHRYLQPTIMTFFTTKLAVWYLRVDGRLRPNIVTCSQRTLSSEPPMPSAQTSFSAYRPFPFAECPDFVLVEHSGVRAARRGKQL